MERSYLYRVKIQFKYYKNLGEKTLDKTSEEKLFWLAGKESNSIFIIVKHLSGNMLSRWTNFLTSDGEKKWRKRDEEFSNEQKNRAELMAVWNKGWSCLFRALNVLNERDLNKEVYIQGIRYSVSDAINRQLAHYSYHVGQIVFIGKIIQKGK